MICIMQHDNDDADADASIGNMPNVASLPNQIIEIELLHNKLQ